MDDVKSVKMPRSDFYAMGLVDDVISLTDELDRVVAVHSQQHRGE